MSISTRALAASRRVSSVRRRRSGTLTLPAVATGGIQTLTPADVAIVGLGYVGLPTAISFAADGASVIGIDVSSARLDAIAVGAVDVLDSDRGRLRTALDTGLLRLTDDAASMRDADVVLICVPTPVDEHLSPDLRALGAACATVVANARVGQCIVLTSTSYVGTTADLLVGPLRQRGFRVGEDIHVAFSPERIDPGNTVHPQHLVPRVVGGVSPASTALASRALARVAPEIHEVSSPEAAELTKLHENTFRAVNIAYANEMAGIAARFGIDVNEVIGAAATKPYGFMPFRPGPGVGGHCIPCDPHYLLWGLREHRALAPMIETAMNQIAVRPSAVVNSVVLALADRAVPMTRARVLVVGVAYKPGVEDVRESPALEIIDRLGRLGASVEFADPLVTSIRRSDGTVMLRTDEPASREWDLVLVHTASPEADLGWTAEVPVVVDATYRLPAAANRIVP